MGNNIIRKRLLLGPAVFWAGALGVCMGLAGQVAAQTIVISEIMYNPPASTNEPDGSVYEFVELRNDGPVAVDLYGASFTKGISYTFSSRTLLDPGEYLVVVRDASAFAQRYPSVTNLASGVFSGKLDNVGEEIKLEDQGGNTLFSVTYEDSYPWPEAPDGHGASLVLSDPDGERDDPESWCASDAYLGAPGQSDLCAQQDVVLNELLTHTDIPLVDAVELHNLTASPIDLDGWYLSDDEVVRDMYRITNLVLAAYGYAVLSESDFGSSFLLSELGEQVYLTAADASSNLTRLADYAVFDAAENGYSFGRYPNGTGTWVTLAERSLGASNGLPRNGPIVVSEIMYNPASDSADDEYLELVNITVSNVPLYDVDVPTNTWSLTSAVDYLFPTGVVLNAGERILVTGAADIEAFRTRYGVSESIQIFGPWSGKLSNGGESVRLRKPGPPETNLVPRILVDRVDYLDKSPWPEAPDGKGPALERIDEEAYGNTAENWLAGSPGGTPGSPLTGGFIQPTFDPQAPAPGQVFTVTVSVVASTLPTQVLMRTSINGVTNDVIMTDDGVSPDALAGDQIYSTEISGQPDGTWLYYVFEAQSADGSSFSYPSPTVNYLPAPALTTRMSGSGLLTNVTATETWQTFEVMGAATDPKLLYFYLDGPGELLLDSVKFIDVTNAVECVTNGSFNAPLSTAWHTNGNHSTSRRELAQGESSNQVLRMIATGAGGGSIDSVYVELNPQVSLGAPCQHQFSIRQVSVEEAQWAWLVIGATAPDVVINEVMYHPDRTNQAPYEYVELYNPAATAIALNGWSLKGVGLDFEPGVSIAAGGFLVCAAVTNDLEVAYGLTNVVSAWTGTLKNGGETLRLINGFGRELDRVDYEDRNPWPTAADGYGPSLERIAVESSGTNAFNWMASGIGTNWQRVAWTGEISAVNQGLSLYLDFDGKCRVDDVSVQPLGGGSELMANGDFESGTNGWSFLGNHERSRIEAGAGRSNSAGLVLSGRMTRYLTKIASAPLIISYGDAETNNVSSSALTTTNGDQYVVSCYVQREGLGGGFILAHEGGAVTQALGSVGTPGASNFWVRTQEPFGVLDVQQNYTLCPVSTANVIRAYLSTTSAVSSVSLAYRSFGTNAYEFTDVDYTSLAMADDGVLPDLYAGDGIYSLSFPVQTQRWTLVRYHVTATDTNGVSTRYPRLDDPSTDLGFWVEELTPQQGQVPNWYVLSDGQDIFYPDVRRGCAVSPNGQVFVDVIIRHRGNPDSPPLETGLALRVHRGNPLDTWFANNQGGINFRHRGNNSQYWYCRVINEYLAYYLQDLIGLPTPRVRHVCLWMDGVPNITMSLEDPEEAFMDTLDMGQTDYLSRSGWRGRVTVGGDEALDNFDGVEDTLTSAAAADKPDAVRTNLAMESIRYSLALFSITGNIDQYFSWNMFQHRDAQDGRWRQYPWDVDKSFFLQYTNLHPYYQTPLHPSVVNTNFNNLLGHVLFYPESGSGSEYTQPYRHRQQSTLWRYCYSVLTETNLFPLLDRVYTQLAPAYTEIGYHPGLLSNQVDEVKAYIQGRREYYINGSWSDREAALWASTNIYQPQVVINELMIDPSSGGEYIELYNPGHHDVDLSWWMLQAGDEMYRLPHETILGATSYLVIADTQILLTNAYTELGDEANMVIRYPGLSLWDQAMVWTNSPDYNTRVVELSQLTLPNSGATVRLCDLWSNCVDSVTYTNTGSWPLLPGTSIELIVPSSDNTIATNWRSSTLVGTPGWKNMATLDTDEDGMADEWELAVVIASGGSLPDVQSVLGEDDFDDDGLSNMEEWILGLDPTVQDAWRGDIYADVQNASPIVWFQTQAPTSAAYQAYSQRLYDLEYRPDLVSTSTWNGVTNYTRRPGTGADITYTNSVGPHPDFYRLRIELQPLR